MNADTHKYSITSFLDKTTGIFNYSSSLSQPFCCFTHVEIVWSSDHYKVLSNPTVDSFQKLF